MLCGSGALPLHMAAGQGTPLKLAAATCGRLLRSVSCSSGSSASTSSGRQSGNPSGAVCWQPVRWRSIISSAGVSGLPIHTGTCLHSSLSAHFVLVSNGTSLCRCVLGCMHPTAGASCWTCLHTACTQIAGFNSRVHVDCKVTFRRLSPWGCRQRGAASRWRPQLILRQRLWALVWLHHLAPLLHHEFLQQVATACNSLQQLLTRMIRGVRLTERAAPQAHS